MLGWYGRKKDCRGGDFGKEFMKSGRNQLKKRGYTLFEEALGILYPLRCPICDGLLLPGKAICDGCRAEAVTLREPVCKRCGKQLQDERAEYCIDCTKKSHRYRQGKAVFLYKGGMKQSLYRFKYAGKREYAAFYAREAADLYGRWVYDNKIEAIVPVPMYRGKQRRRGYNQAEVFAEALGRELQLPVEKRMVRRTRDTTPQKNLNERERKDNLKNAFQFTDNIVKYKQILLTDDIYTTGSTIDAVAEALISGGVRDIYYICISIGVGF